MVYLIRHAEKKSNSLQARLTDEGVYAALNYGYKLKREGVKIDVIKSSPIKRCLETARFISRGYGREILIEETKLLGDPGIFADDSVKAMELFNSSNAVDIINRQLKGDTPEGFVSIEEAAASLKADIESSLKEEKVALYISHDVIISPFTAYLQGIESLGEDEIVNYLDTVKITVDSSKELSFS